MYSECYRPPSTSSNGSLGHPVGYPVARSPPGVTTLPVDSGYECCIFRILCVTVLRTFFSFLEYENCKIIKSSGEATSMIQKSFGETQSLFVLDRVK